MATQEVAVKANLNIVLKSDTEQLEEVMVVAYGTAKKSAFFIVFGCHYKK